MSKIKKVTVHLPSDLLSKVQKSTGESITEILRQGLQLLASKESSKYLATMRGKVKINFDFQKHKDSRE